MSLLLVLTGAPVSGVTADWATVEGGDNAAFAARLDVNAAWATGEGADNAAFAVNLSAAAVWNTTEGADNAAFVASVQVNGVWASLEGADVAEFTGSVTSGVSADWDSSESGDGAEFEIDVQDAPAPSFFGGGPFIRKYGYYGYRTGQEDEDEEAIVEARAVRDALPGPEAQIVEEALQKAVEARSEPEWMDAQRVYEGVLQRIRGPVLREVREALEMGQRERLKRDRIRAMWQAELSRRAREREDEDTVMLLSSMDLL
jgi:hypothetical protein